MDGVRLYLPSMSKAVVNIEPDCGRVWTAVRLMEIRAPRSIAPFIVFALVVFSVYGYGVHLVVDAVSRDAGQGRLILLALAIAGTLGGLCFAFSWLLLLRHRLALRRIERQSTAKTDLRFPVRG